MSKYYAITTSMTFEKTVLVPVDSVGDIHEAMDLVDTSIIDFLDEEAVFNTKPSDYADANGMYELSEDDAKCYQIIQDDGLENEI